MQILHDHMISMFIVINELILFFFKKKRTFISYLKTMSQLNADCLNEIFEYLGDDRSTLYSCILVNRLWCEVSVRIFWRNILNYSTSNFSTFIACLPKESKEILCNNG